MHAVNLPNQCGALPLRPCKVHVSQSPYMYYQPTGHCMHSRVPKQHPTCARDIGYTLIHTCASKRSHLSCIRHIQLALILSYLTFYICASVWPRMVMSGPGPSPACAIQSIQAVAAAAELIMVDENHLHAMPSRAPQARPTETCTSKLAEPTRSAPRWRRKLAWAQYNALK